MSDTVTLVFNDSKQEVIVSRKAVSESCFYLSCLLDGSFREAKQSSVKLVLQDVSFEAFKGVVDYASTGYFNGTLSDIYYYIEMLKLAILWIYDDLVKLLESFLINRVDLETVQDLYNIAVYFNLALLKKECSKYIAVLDKGITVPKPWGRCPVDNHQDHSYRKCMTGGEKEKFPELLGWGDEPEIPVDKIELSCLEREYKLFSLYRAHNSYRNIGL